VKLTPLKQRIFDVIRRAGPDGIYHDDLFSIIYQHHEKIPTEDVLKAHCYQLRKLGYKIRGCKGGQRDGLWRVQR
jgi:hypothetical protein